MSRWLHGLGFLLLTASCSSRETSVGREQPISIEGGQFVWGSLPGEPPLEPGEGTPLDPTTTSAQASTAYLLEGAAGLTFSGLASEGSKSIAARIEGVGDGYWVVPTAHADPTAGNRATWSFTADFNDSLRPGRRRLLTVALDADGRAGTQAAAVLCIQSLVPDNGNACVPARPPPALVVGLRWNTSVDLDLKLVTPGGAIISPKQPGAPVTAEGQPANAALDLDSNQDCRIDGRQREHIVFQDRPAAGTYAVYANLNRACDEASVTYSASYYVRTKTNDDTYGVVSELLGSGSLIDEQANGDASLGTFIGEFVVQ